MPSPEQLKNRPTFSEWFNELKILAHTRDEVWILVLNNPESYRDYYDDGDSPNAVLKMEIEHARRLQRIKDRTFKSPQEV